MNHRETGQESSSLDLTQVFCLEKEIEDLRQNIITDKGRLESLKKEITQAEQSLSETEARAKNEEKMLQELYDQKKTLADQKTSLEEQRERLSEDINEISETLQEKDDRLKEIKDELAVAEREKRLVSKKRRLVWKVVLVSLVAVILCGWIYFNNEISSWKSDYEDAMAEKEEAEKLYKGVAAEKEEMESLYENVKSQKEKAESLYEKVKAEKEEAESLYENVKTEKEKTESLYEDAKAQKEEALEKVSRVEAYAEPAMIKVNRVYNSDKITNKISDNLKASEMRYLTFDFDILFLEDDVENAKVYFDVYYPDGSMKRSSNYNPLGHTGSYEFVGIDNAVGKINGVVGWGNSKESTYPAGTYCVDFIYKNVIIHSQKVIITK